MKLSRPVQAPYSISLEFGALYFSEPNQWLYADGSIGLSGALPGAKYGPYHDGVDYAVSSLSPVKAPGPGVVTKSGWDDTGFGLCLRIDHGGVESILAHLHDLAVVKGTQVKSGELVALSDTTGNASGPHVHWSIRDLKTGHYLPPARFVFDQTPAEGRLTFKDVRYLAEQASFHGEAKLTIAAIAYAESRFNPTARFVNNDQWHSVDRGILQINNHWHPEVSDAVADDPAQAFAEAWRISSSGTSFSPWSTYTSGVYRAWLNAPASLG